MSRLTPFFGTFAALALFASGCNGYADLPVPQRETAELVVEDQQLFAGQTGQVQLRAELPSDVVGPVTVVAPFATDGANALVMDWAAGPCEGFEVPAEAASAPRYCVAVLMASAVGARAPFPIGLVLETRGDGRRFSLVADEVTP